jgi:ribonuclease HII
VSIAAASILAKVERDRRMEEYDEMYPQYGLAQHKGYGTPEHLDALKRYGPTPLHRFSYAPVREARCWASGAQQSPLPLELIPAVSAV